SSWHWVSVIPGGRRPALGGGTAAPALIVTARGEVRRGAPPGPAAAFGIGGGVVALRSPALLAGGGASGSVWSGWLGPIGGAFGAAGGLAGVVSLSTAVSWEPGC